jgi:ATP-dependent Clp protease ATP-binding subunit ClpA
MSDDPYDYEDDRPATDPGPHAVPDPRPRATVGELQDMVDDMIAHMEAAKSMPLSSNVLVDRESFLDMLYRLRAELPDELRAARWMVREREAFIARTNERAHEIIERAQNESRRLVSESYVLAEAVEEANILVRRAEGEARRLRLEAEDELEKELVSVEQLMAELIRKIHGARAELHEARPPAPDVPY